MIIDGSGNLVITYNESSYGAGIGTNFDSKWIFRKE
jgi:hypothetical protein